jgi:hypothetical protein
MRQEVKREGNGVLAADVKDSPQNLHNRDSFADEWNRRIGPPGSFWGCAPSSAPRSLTQRIWVFQFPHHNLAEWQGTEIVARYRVATQSVWNLNCGVSVGGQTILGIKHLNELGRLVCGPSLAL